MRQQDKSLWAKIKECITGLVEKLKNAYKDLEPGSAIARQTRSIVTQSEAILEAWTDVATDAIVNYNLQDFGQKNNTPDEVRFSQRKFDSMANQFADEIENWNSEGREQGQHFILGSTGEILQGLGAIESDIYINGDKINTILQEHPEITMAEIKQIPKILNDPVLILKSRNVGRSGQNSRMTLFGSLKGTNGQPVMTVFDLRPMENHIVISDMQKVTSTYTKTTNAVQFIQNSYVMYADKKRATPLLRTIGFYMPIELLQSGFIGSITYRGQKVNLYGEKFSNVIREGDTLYSSRNQITQEQNQEMENHFGTTSNYDVAGYILTDGKMLDFSGRHWGDTSSDFRQVDHRDIWEVWEHDDRDGLQEMVSLIAGGGIRLSPESGGINLSIMPNQQQISTLRGYINHFRGDVAVDIDSVDGKTIQSFTYGRGVSSSKVISDLKAYFESGAVPESRESVRDFLYSARNVEQTESEQFKNWFGDWQNDPANASKVVNADGTPMVMYHGSPAQFTIFEKKKAKSSGMYGRGFYFTNSETHAGQYGNRYSVYLNVWNPLEHGRSK